MVEEAVREALVHNGIRLRVLLLGLGRSCWSSDYALVNGSDLLASFKCARVEILDVGEP